MTIGAFDDNPSRRPQESTALHVPFLFYLGPVSVEGAHLKGNTLIHPREIHFNANSRNGEVGHELADVCIVKPATDRLLDTASMTNRSRRPLQQTRRLSRRLNGQSNRFEAQPTNRLCAPQRERPANTAKPVELGVGQAPNPTGSRPKRTRRPCQRERTSQHHQTRRIRRRLNTQSHRFGGKNGFRRRLGVCGVRVLRICRWRCGGLGRRGTRRLRGFCSWPCRR